MRYGAIKRRFLLVLFSMSFCWFLDERLDDSFFGGMDGWLMISFQWNYAADEKR